MELRIVNVSEKLKIFSSFVIGTVKKFYLMI